VRGPQLRLRFAVGRLWECPNCRRRDTTPGTVTSAACQACSSPDALAAVWMRLIDEFPRKRAIMPTFADASASPSS
jgi:Zn ribbon nucleic-acid-binding protein